MTYIYQTNKYLYDSGKQRNSLCIYLFCVETSDINPKYSRSRVARSIPFSAKSATYFDIFVSFTLVTIYENFIIHYFNCNNKNNDFGTSFTPSTILLEMHEAFKPTWQPGVVRFKAGNGSFHFSSRTSLKPSNRLKRSANSIYTIGCCACCYHGYSVFSPVIFILELALNPCFDSDTPGTRDLHIDLVLTDFSMDLFLTEKRSETSTETH